MRQLGRHLRQFLRRPGQWSPICGTSLATPLFAGIVALADQYAGHGKAHSLGLINQAIYTIAARHEPGIVDIRTWQQHPDVRPGRQAVHGQGVHRARRL